MSRWTQAALYFGLVVNTFAMTAIYTFLARRAMPVHGLALIVAQWVFAMAALLFVHRGRLIAALAIFHAVALPILWAGAVQKDDALLEFSSGLLWMLPLWGLTALWVGVLYRNRYAYWILTPVLSAGCVAEVVSVFIYAVAFGFRRYEDLAVLISAVPVVVLDAGAVPLIEHALPIDRPGQAILVCATVTLIQTAIPLWALISDRRSFFLRTPAEPGAA